MRADEGGFAFRPAKAAVMAIRSVRGTGRHVSYRQCLSDANHNRAPGSD